MVAAVVAGSGSLVGSGSLEVVVAGSLEVVVVVLASVASVAFVEVVGAVIPWIGLDCTGLDSLLNIITL